MSSSPISLPNTEVILEIPFHDVDMMEVAWHGHYAKYFEVARCALLDKISYNYEEMKASGFAWPIIELKLRYINPARFGQKIKVEAKLVEYELRLKIDFLISDVETGGRLTKGHSVQVAIDMATEKLLIGSPPILYEKLGIPL
jgi:acyl-CoA thioester hydrolase